MYARYFAQGLFDVVVVIGHILRGDAQLPVTATVAQALELYPRKGCVAEGSDADLILVDDDLCIREVVAKGRLLMRDGQVLKRGFFED